jgi:hypothetical protein
MGLFRSECRACGQKPEGKRTLGRHRSRCKDNIKTDVMKIEW